MAEPRPAWRRVVVAAVVLTLGITILYALTVPALRGPDEDWHLDYVVHLGETWDVPDVGESVRKTPARPTLEAMYGSDRNELGPFASATAMPRDQRPPYGESTERSWNMHMAQHPPGYYVLAAAWDQTLQALAGERALDARGLGQRLLSLLLAATTSALVVVGARDLGLRPSRGLFAAMLLLVIPMWGFMGGVANNDDLLILSSTAATVLGIRVLQGDRGRWTHVLLGVAVAVACLTKSMGLALVLWVGVVHVAAMQRHGREVAQQLRLLAPTAAIVAVGAGWWWVRNLLVYGKLQPSSFAPREVDPATLDGLRWAWEFVTWTITRFWGLFGGSGGDTLGPGIVALGTAALAGAWVVGFRRADRQTRITMVTLTSMLAIVAVASAVVGWQNYQKMGTTRTQGRYYFFAVPALVLAVTLGLDRARLVSRRAAIVLGAAVTGTNLIALVLIANQFWTGAGLADGPATLVAWSPWPVAPTVACLTAGLVVLLGVPGVAAAAFPPGEQSVEHATPR